MNERRMGSDKFFDALMRDNSYQYWSNQANHGKNEARRTIGFKRQYKRYWQVYNSVGQPSSTSGQKG